MPRVLGLFLLAHVLVLFRRLRFGPRMPTWTFGFEAIVELLRSDWASSRSWTFPRLRADLEKRPVPTSVTRRVRQRTETIGGVPGVWFEAKEGATRGGVLLFLHGGSYIFGSPKTHADIIARLVVATGLRAFAPIYRLAPEHPYPAALEDALAVFAGLEGLGHAATGIVLAGDSAGGHLALELQLARRDRGVPQAVGALLVSPWLDLSASSASARSETSVDYGEREMLLAHARAFAGSLPLDDPRISPFSARLEGLHPLCIQVGTAERLHDEGVEFTRRARAAGVSVRLDLLVDMPHNGPILAEYSEEGRRGVELGAQFLIEVSPLGACTSGAQR